MAAMFDHRRALRFFVFWPELARLKLGYALLAWRARRIERQWVAFEKKRIALLAEVGRLRRQSRDLGKEADELVIRLSS